MAAKPSFLDGWQVECAVRLVQDYGHDWSTAMGLAGISRHLLEESLARPLPLVLVTTC
jgi:hypothetical protein